MALSEVDAQRVSSPKEQDAPGVGQAPAEQEPAAATAMPLVETKLPEQPPPPPPASPRKLLAPKTSPKAQKENAPPTPPPPSASAVIVEKENDAAAETEVAAGDEHDNNAAPTPLASADSVANAVGDADAGDSDDAENADGAADDTVMPLADAGRVRSARRATHAANFGALLHSSPDAQAEYFLKASQRCSSPMRDRAGRTPGDSC